jgi:putative membrane protein
MTIVRCVHALLYAGLLTLAGCAASGGASGQRAAAGFSGGKLSARISDADLRLIGGMAQANIAQIQAGKLALARTLDTQVKAFAQSVVDEHGAALQQLEQMAQSAGLALPGDTDLVHRAVAADMSLLSGAAFDQQYLGVFGIADHKAMQALLEQALFSAGDPALKAYAQQMMALVLRHLEHAQRLAARQG